MIACTVLPNGAQIGPFTYSTVYQGTREYRRLIDMKDDVTSLASKRTLMPIVYPNHTVTTAGI